jgi:hypothetical protein
MFLVSLEKWVEEIVDIKLDDNEHYFCADAVRLMNDAEINFRINHLYITEKTSFAVFWV